MNWQILAIISVFFFSIAVLVLKIILKGKTDIVPYAVLFQCTTGTILGGVGLLFGDMSFPLLGPLVFNLVLLAIFYGVGNVFIFKSIQLLEASTYTIIFSTRVLFTMLASFLFLSERLTIYHIIGTTFILLGVLLVTLKSLTSFDFSSPKGELFALLAAIFFGFELTNDRILLNSLHLYPYMFLSFILPSLLIALLYHQKIKNIKVFADKNIISKILLLSFIYGLASIAFFSALQKAPSSSQVAAVNVSQVVITVLLSIIFLKERDSFIKKIIGAVLSFIGLLLVS